MARRGLTQAQLQIIEASIGAGDSNYQAAVKADCSESAVRTAVKKYGFVKNALKELAHKEVDTIIMQEEIKTHKNALNAVETHVYQELLLEEVQARNVTFNVAQKIQLGIYAALEKGSTQQIIKVKQYGDKGQVIGETADVLDVEHTPKDYVDMANANDRAAMTQGIVQRHAPKVDMTQQQFQGQVSTVVEIVEDRNQT